MKKIIKKMIKVVSSFLMTFIVVVLLASLGLYYYRNVQGNVLDRIKRSEGSDYLFVKSGAFDMINDAWDIEAYDFFEVHYLSYKDKYLKKDFRTAIKFTKYSEALFIYNFKKISNNSSLNIGISYDYKLKVLTFEPIEIIKYEENIEFIKNKDSIEKYLNLYSITTEDIREYQNYALYDVVVKTWVEGNGGNYEREKKKLQKCTIVDKTFDYDYVGVVID